MRNKNFIPALYKINDLVQWYSKIFWFVINNYKYIKEKIAIV